MFPSAPVIASVLPQIDRAAMLVPQSAVPTCPHCGGPVSFNLRGGDWFLEHKYEPQQARFEQWLDSVRDVKLVVLDIGSGFNTPSGERNVVGRRPLV